MNHKPWNVRDCLSKYTETKQPYEIRKAILLSDFECRVL